MTPSEFIEQFHSHAILDARAIAERYQAATNMLPTWPVYTYEEMVTQIEQRGKGGELEHVDSATYCSASDMASSTAFLLAGKTSSKMGMGFAFRENLQFLKDAGY